MKRYRVVLDYITTCDVIVDARDEESAQRKVERYVGMRKYARYAVEHMADNTAGGVCGGFDIADVSELEDDWKPKFNETRGWIAI